MASDTHLSKRLSWLLRHGAIEEGFPIRSDGYIEVNAILKHPKYSRDFNLEILQRIVSNDKKQRYTLRCDVKRGCYEIRANQGHSLEEVESTHCLERVHNADDIQLAVHGTYYKYWPRIRMEGLRTMGRLHVHFAMHDDNRRQREQTGAISGFRSNCEILIYLDVRKAMEVGGMEMYRSSNNVILCAGIDGCISKEYFLKVIDRRTGKELDF